MSDGDDRDRPRMAGDDANDSQALTGGDIKQDRALVARISCLSQDRPDLNFASMQVGCAMASPSVRDMERGKRIGLGSQDQYACSAGNREVSWRRIQTPIDVVTELLHDHMRGEHCPAKTAPEGPGIQSLAKDLVKICKLNLHLDASATMCLVNRRGWGKAKHVSVERKQEASKSEMFVTQKVCTHVKPADLMTKTLLRHKIVQLTKQWVIDSCELGYAMQTSLLTATCRRKRDRGVFAVGHGVESGTDHCEVKILDGKDSVNSRPEEGVLASGKRRALHTVLVTS